VRAWRREVLDGLSGRVLEVGAGTGTNFALYPDSVKEVLALEPERRLAPIARQAALSAPVPVTVSDSTIESLDAGEPFDAVVCSLVLCSVDQPEAVLQQIFSILRPGGELRYLEHIASAGARGRLQRVADATVWPRLFGNCHTHRDTERAIGDAGFRPQTARHDLEFPAWVPMPVSEVVIGRAVKP
jgi:SAM-dependent methyltransferase